MADVAQEALPLLAQVRAEMRPPDGARPPSFCPQTHQNGLSCVQVSRLQTSAVFRAARELDFENDTFGSFAQLLCDRGDASSNASAGVRAAAGRTRNGATFTGNSSGRSIKLWFSCLATSVFFFTLNKCTSTTTRLFPSIRFCVTSVSLAR